MSYPVCQSLPMKSPDSPDQPTPSNQTKDYDQLVAEAYERIQQNKRKKKQEELRLAKRQLRNPNITEEEFKWALLSLKVTASRRALVEKAYARLSAKDKRRVRHTMLDFYHGLDDYETAKHFLPKRFDGWVGYLETSYAWDIWSKLDDRESLKRHWKALTARSPRIPHIFDRTSRLADLADYFFRAGDWRLAAEICREIPVELVNSLQDDLGPMLAQCGELLAACAAARTHLAKCNSSPAPDLKIPLFVDLTFRHDDIEDGLRFLQQKLHRLLGKKRRKELNQATA